MLIFPQKQIKNIRDYIGLSQNIQQLLVRKEFKTVDNFLKNIKINKKNKFIIVQILRQTFPHKKNIGSWKKMYSNSLSLINIDKIQLFGEMK